MKTALVTGASSGIGLEIARCHAQKGGDLIIVARSENKLNSLKTSLENEYQISCHVIAMDLIQEHAAKILFDEVSEKGLSIDYLINNAGIGGNDRFENIELSNYQQMLQLNINALTDLTYYFIKEKKSCNEGGKILNVASTAAFQAVPFMTVYAATKSYVLSLTEGLAIELKGSNLSVTALCPGPTKSNFASAAGMNKKLGEFPLFPDAESVAKYGYDAMLKDEVVAIHGAINKVGVAAGKFSSRKLASSMAGLIFKKRN